MGMTQTLFSSPVDFLCKVQPENPVFFFNSKVLKETAAHFMSGFPGQVTYAVKSNPSDLVLNTLVGVGLEGFDVASSVEIEQIRGLSPTTELHFNNPVRSSNEIRTSLAYDVQSYSVDSESELTKLLGILSPGAVEIAVRFKLPVPGAAYDFGAKFGATPEVAAQLLGRVAAAGFIPSLTFHPGTQCTAPDAWVHYIQAASEISHAAGVELARLNVGGGFPSHRMAAERPDLDQIFETISNTTVQSFGASAPGLVCEPGRAMVAESHVLAARIKSVRDAGTVFLNDGIYGALAEWPSIGASDRVQVVSASGYLRNAANIAFDVFGPTCDSIDKVPGKMMLPADTMEDDYVLFHGMGAYSVPIATRFNGFGDHMTVSVADFEPLAPH
jgi:ornithine decarboxylase